MRHILQAIFILLILFPDFELEAQLTSGSADFADSTVYKIDGIADSIYIFYQANRDKYIEAFSPNGDSVIFEWYLYNNATGVYTLDNSTVDVSSRILFNNENIFSDPLGYMLVINDGAVTDTFRCWLMLDNFQVAIINADTLDTGGEITKVVRDANKRCSLTGDIKARIDSSYMFYHNPLDGSLIHFPFEAEISKDNWYSNPDPGNDTINSFGQNDNTWLNVTVFNPYWKDCYLILEVTDELGFTQKDSVFYESIIPHANFLYTHIPLNDPFYYPDHSERYYEIYGPSYDLISAPALFLFEDSSENANRYTWLFGDTLTESITADSLLHTYALPGIYYPRLIAYHYLDFSLETCVDTFPKYFEPDAKAPIEVEQAQILSNNKELLPNVFAPPNGSPNYFRFYDDASITDFEIAIYNRYGKRVYHFAGNIRDWEGWDGKIKNSNKVVQTGVYYYVVKEISGLPDWETHEVRDIHEEFPGNNEKDSDGIKLNNIHRGYVHVYNSE
jgi:hypothetical protein